MAKVKIINTQENSFTLHHVDAHGVAVNAIIPEKAGDVDGVAEVDEELFDACYAASAAVRDWFESGKLKTPPRLDNRKPDVKPGVRPHDSK